ncbi:cupin domain-containing protein [Candidatus Fermentibacteria bacterium]|nr:cupin domain-containing protein [Candidatus Fermentibacteria bacterium]
MLMGTINDAILNPVNAEGASGASISWLIDRAKGAPTFAMRLIRLEPNGQTPRHEHAWEHEVFVIDGTGKLWAEGHWTALERGCFALVKPGEEHQFAAGLEGMRFLCLVPHGAT